MALVTCPKLKAVVPPFELVSAVPPTEPVDLSQARYVIEDEPLKSELVACKRILWFEFAPSSNRELLADTLPKLVQLLPPFTENCQLPFALSTEVIATPLTPPAAEEFNRVETRLPELLVISSLIVVKLAVVKALPPPPLKLDEPDVDNTGAGDNKPLNSAASISSVSIRPL